MSIAALPGPARGAPRRLWRGGRLAAIYNRAQLQPAGGRGWRAPRPHARGLVPINCHPSTSPCPLCAAPRPCRGARPVDTGRWPRAACSCPRSHAAVISGDVDTGEPSPSRRAPHCCGAACDPAQGRALAGAVTLCPTSPPAPSCPRAFGLGEPPRTHGVQEHTSMGGWRRRAPVSSCTVPHGDVAPLPWVRLGDKTGPQTCCGTARRASWGAWHQGTRSSRPREQSWGLCGAQNRWAGRGAGRGAAGAPVPRGDGDTAPAQAA